LVSLELCQVVESPLWILWLQDSIIHLWENYT
jgi:hypothetical protein